MKNKSQKRIENRTRCPWPGNNPLMIAYHDDEWGVPLHDDQKLFEFMVLDAFQAGLSWNTIINKRTNFEKAFSGFDVKKISRYTEKDFDRLMQDSGIIRNRLKIRAAIQKALDAGGAEAGSSNRVERAVIEVEQPSLDNGEQTDKGTVSQRAVLERRTAVVDELRAITPSPRTIVRQH